MTRASLATLLIALAGSATAQVPVAFVAPSGGQYEELGGELAGMARYVVEYLNERDDEPKIELSIIRDDCDAARARDIAAALAGDGWEGFKPAIVIGHCPAVLGEVAPIYAAAGLPFFTPFAPSDEEIYHYYNASVFQLEPGGGLMAERAVEALEADREELDRLRGAEVAVLTDDTAYTRRFAQALEGGLRGIPARTSVAGSVAELGDAQAVFYAGTDVEAYRELLAHSAEHGTRVLLVRRGARTGYEWFELMREAEGRGIDVQTIMPVARNDTPDAERYYWRDWGFQDTTAQLVLASFELALQALEATGGDVRLVPQAVRGRDYPTILGPLRSGETGAIRPLPTEVVTADEWLEGVRGDVTASVEPPPPGSPPVYNLEIDPLLEQQPIVLEPDAVTELSFFIGGSTDANVLGQAEINLEDIEQLAGDEPLTVTVTLNCLVCETDTYQRRSLTYDPEERRSLEKALFSITPKRGHGDAGTGIGLLVFAVDARGIDLDVIQVPVFVGTPTAAQRAAYEPPAVRTIDHEELGELESPDLVIDITDAPVALNVTLLPQRPELVAALSAELGSDDGEWTFRAGASKADVDGLVRDAYFELRAMINQNEQLLQQVYASQDAAVVLTPGAANLDFEDSDRDAMLATLRKHGARLYQRVFIDGERELRGAMRVLEAFTPADGRPLTVHIRATNVYAPWQLLYPRRRGEVVPERFWGLRYVLGAQQWVQAAPVSFAALMDPPAADETLFAAYRGAPGSDDPVALRARLLAEHVAGKLGDALDLAESRDEFLARLEDEGSFVRLLVAYGHASSGTGVVAGAGGGPVIAEDVAGARFMLAADEVIVPGDIDDRRPEPEEGLLLASQPIVIFNACETGSSGARAANNNGFVGALTRAGARAVIVTETPVWNNFAFHFGKHVIDGLFAGQRIDVALREARLLHLRHWNNPLGLVYTLYGNPAARIRSAADDG